MIAKECYIKEYTMKLLKHQELKAKSIKRKLNLYRICLFAGEVRSGKTAAFVQAAKDLSKDDYIVITKKGAIEGVKKFTPNVTNYHQACKLDPIYDVVVLDECHRYISSIGKRSKLWRDIHRIASKASYVIFSSGTPTPESFAMLFNMLAVSNYSPWKRYESLPGRVLAYNKWHKDYGIPYDIVIGWNDKTKSPRTAIGRDRVKDDLIQRDIDHLIVSMTRKEAGHIYEPTDKLHKVPLTPHQVAIYNSLDKLKIYEVDSEYSIVCDTASKYLQKLHQVSGGFVNAVDLDETPKIFQVDSNKVQYIKDHFDPNDTIILAFYIAEQDHLSNIFPHVGSITKNSDGVDYSHYKNMIIYSMGFSAATYQQVIGRQLNFMTRKEEVIIHFLISGIDEYVYKAVSNKNNFTTKWYKGLK